MPKNGEITMHDFIKELLKEDLKIEELFYSITDYATEREIEVSFDELSEIEQNSFMVGKFLLEVNNGGFDQYFVNTEGAYARRTVDFLDIIGETSFPKLLEEAMSVNKAIISDDRKLEEFEVIDDKFYGIRSDEYEDLYTKFIDYLKCNIDLN